MMPSPAGCLAITETSPAPETVYVMLLSSPLSEKMQMSAVVVPLAGLVSGTGFPASVQELLEVEKAPSAATFRSTSFPPALTPAVVGSTTTMSCPVAAGVVLLSEIASSEVFGAATASETTLDVVPPGFWICTVTFPATATSVAVTGAVHCVADAQVVVRRVPPMSRDDPAPPFVAT